jgi:outer membrane protein assembly factor BamB
MSMKSKIYGIAVIIILTATVAYSSDWPAFHGRDRSNRSLETGLLKEWPKGGPKLLWTASGVGSGYSGVTVSDGIVYSAGNKNKAHFVYAFDLSGKRLWEKQVGAAYDARLIFRMYQGSRATPTVDGGNLFHLTDAGLLVALNSKTGEIKWTVNIAAKYGTDAQKFGYSESPLVVGDRVYVAPYGQKVTLVCLDKHTGDVIWESGYVKTEEKGYASHVLAEHGGSKQLIAFTSEFLYSFDAESGKQLWTVPFRNKQANNCTDVIYRDGHVFASSGYGMGSMLVRLVAKNGKPAAEKVYETKLLDNLHGGLVFHDGYVYGSGHDSKGWFCLDFKTGKQMWNAPGKGSLVFADGMLYLYGETGTMSLVKATPEKFVQVSSFEVPSGGKGSNWAHPAISYGVLYLRHADNIYAYQIK